MTINVIELLDQMLHLPHAEMEAAFMALGETLAQRDSPRLAKVLSKHILPEITGDVEPGMFHFFALTLHLTLKQLAHRVEVDKWLTESQSEPTNALNAWTGAEPGEC